MITKSQRKRARDSARDLEDLERFRHHGSALLVLQRLGEEQSPPEVTSKDQNPPAGDCKPADNPSRPGVTKEDLNPQEEGTGIVNMEET